MFKLFEVLPPKIRPQEMRASSLVSMIGSGVKGIQVPGAMEKLDFGERIGVETLFKLSLKVNP